MTSGSGSNAGCGRSTSPTSAQKRHDWGVTHTSTEPVPADDSTSLPLSTQALIGAFAVSGAVHMIRPEVFDPLIPPALGSPRAWTYASGLAELACAAGLATRAPWAPKASAGLLAGVWVGNWWMAIAATRAKRRRPALIAASWLRVPLQVPMVRAALNSPTRSR